MGRSYFVDESVQKYLTKVAAQQNRLVTGLLIGQCCAQRDYVILAVQTPPKDDSMERPAKAADSPDVDEEWFCLHAAQIGRMLPGGFLLVGVFLISNVELSKEAPNILRKLVFAAEKCAMKRKLWSVTDEEVTDRVALHICSSTNKIVCRTFDVRDPKSTAKPADWKYQNASLSWLSVECNVDVDLGVSLPSSNMAYAEQHECTRARLARWAQDIEGCDFLFNGQLRDKDGDLLEDQKKGRSAANSGRQIVSATILAPSHVSARCTARVQACKSSLRIRGVVKCRGFVCNNKPKVRDAVQVIKRDLLNTISDRCEVMFEDLLLNASDPGTNVWLLPQRVFLPLPASGAELCDYIIGEETRDDVQNRLQEILDQQVTYEDLEFVEEKMSRSVEEQTVPKSDARPCDPKSAASKERRSWNVPQSIGIVMATAVVLLAILVYLLK